MNTAHPKEALHAEDEGFAEQWNDLQYFCSQCGQFAHALAFIWSATEGIPDNSQRKHRISAAHFLACELDAHAGSLEFDLRTLKRGSCAALVQYYQGGRRYGRNDRNSDHRQLLRRARKP